MNTNSEESDVRPCWFVGAVDNETGDQFDLYVEQGIWENGWWMEESKIWIREKVKSIQVGDRIAMKSSYTRKNGLPFDYRGLFASVMAIKATGTVVANPGNGHVLRVDWTPVQPPREWYFFTNRTTLWEVSPGEWWTDALIAFAFHEESQDWERFRDAWWWDKTKP